MSSKAVAESPVLWFAVLDRARRQKKPDLSRYALRKLKKLGVVVRFQEKREAGHA